MLRRTTVFDGVSNVALYQSDVLTQKEVIPATIATNAITLTGAILAQTIVQRTITAAGTPTVDTAANIISSIEQQLGVSAIDNGTSWRVRWINNAAFADTVTAPSNAGITVVNGVVNASSVKDFLVQVNCGAPAIAPGNCIVTNGSAVVTLQSALGQNTPNTDKFVVGMVVTNSQNGLQGTTIVSIQPGVGFTLSGTATSGQTSQVTLNLSPQITITGIGQMLL